MPAFKFKTVPSDAEYTLVIEAFGIDASSPQMTAPNIYSDERLLLVYTRLDKIREVLLKCYHRRNWATCVPEFWTRLCVMKVLRHVLHTRKLRLSSKVVRRGGGFEREYSIAYPIENLLKKHCVVSIGLGRKSEIL